MNEEQQRAANRQRVAEAASLRQQEEAEARKRESQALWATPVEELEEADRRRRKFAREHAEGMPDNMKKQSGKPDTQPVRRYRRRKVRRGW